jgi:AmmeMemoRadiSam system protein A
MKLTPESKRELFAIARASIESALAANTRMQPAPPAPPHLNDSLSTFVTLRIERDLRGCCGTLLATRPLAVDVWHNAWASAFADPRFPPLTSAEWPRVHLHISILTPPESVETTSEADLLALLRPGTDGLVLSYRGNRATFLPAVWEEISEPQAFVAQLKRKAGWPADFWSPEIRVERYEAVDLDEEK